VRLLTCGAWQPNVDVNVLFVVQFCRHAESRFTVTSVVTKEKPAKIQYELAQSYSLFIFSAQSAPTIAG